MIQYIYFVKCPDCEDEPFDFFDEAKQFALGCLSKKPIITQIEVDRNDFGECADSCDLGTVWSWEDVMKETDAEPTISIFTKDDLVKNYDPDNDPEFADLEDRVCEDQCDSAYLQENIQSEINQGDLVDFGTYGQLYVCNPTYSSDYYWVTDLEEDRNDKNAFGWSIKKDLAQRIIDSCFDESCKKAIPEGMTIEQLVEEMEENEDTVECTWCNDLFDKDQCRKEVNLGYLCSRCEAAIKSRGEKLTFEENDYWDFLDEE